MDSISHDKEYDDCATVVGSLNALEIFFHFPSLHMQLSVVNRENDVSVYLAHEKL